MREMGRVFWCHSVGGFGVALVSIFIPIFLLKIGYSFQQVLVYLLLQHIYATLLQYPVGRAFKYVRPHHLLVVGTLSYAVLFGLLISLQAHNWPLALLALAWAINRTVYWTAFHYSFSMARAHTHAGRQIAGINALTMLSATVAPAIGGIVATIFGITYIYIAGIVLLALAIVPMTASNGGQLKFLSACHGKKFGTCGVTC